MRRRGESGQVAAGLLAVIVIVGLVIGGWFLYWFVFRESVNREAVIHRESFEFQQARRDDLVKLVRQVKTVDVQIATPGLSTGTKSALTAQRTAIVNQACNTAAEIRNGLPSGTRDFVLLECEGR